MRRNIQRVILLCSCLLPATAFAQSQGPITPKTGQQQASPQEPIIPKTPRGETAAPIKNEPPPIPVDEIIQKFAAKEAEFRIARGNYTYSQSVRMEELDGDDKPAGRFELKSDIVFSPNGKRYEKITYAPQPTLQRISVTPEDMKDLENIQPFVLTTEELPKYVLEYQGRQQVDEVGTYVFSVRPKVIEKGQRYFEGTIWVDDLELQIVKTYGKAVPDLRDKGENLFPRFETFREQIDGKFWFPTFTRADDVLRFKTGDVHIRLTVRYTNYKQFKVTYKLGDAVPTEPPQKPPL